MKKLYSAPVMDIEKFDVVDVITDSSATTGLTGQNTTAGTNEAYDTITGKTAVKGVHVEW